MRFRAPNLGRQDAAGGIGNFFQSLAMAPMLEAQAREQAQDAQSKRELMGTQQQLYQSQIGGNLAEAALKQRELQTINERPDNLRLMAASRAGVSVPDLSAAISERQNGAPAMGPSYLSEPIAGLGPSGRTANFDDVISSLYAPAMTTPAGKSIDFDSLAKMRGEYQDQGAMSEALDMARGGNYMGSSALSAVRGKKEFTPFAAVGNTGTALNQVTGAQAVSNPEMNSGFTRDVEAGIKQKGASASASYASADNSRASAAKSRAEMERAIKSGDIQVVQAPDGTVQLVNKVTGLSRPAVGMDGKPVLKGGGSGGAPSEGERKAATLLTRLRGSQSQLMAAAGQDASAVKPGMVAEFVRAVGGDTAANVVTPEARQQIEAAQLDMLDAALTLGTGAAYTREQLMGYRKSYFPQIGDDPKTVNDKQVRLANVIRAAEIASGRAVGDVPTFNTPGAAPGSSGPPRVASDDDYNALPPGSVFIDPQGKQRRKP